MVNQDILGGMRNAISRGDSLEKAMFSFYNAGYKRDEIYEAANIIRMEMAGQHISQPVQPAISTQPVNIQPNIQPIVKSQVQLPAPLTNFPEKPAQVISKYENKTKKPFLQSTAFVILLAGILLVLVDVLIFILFYKGNFINELTSIFK